MDQKISFMFPASSSPLYYCFLTTAAAFEPLGGCSYIFNVKLEKGGLMSRRFLAFALVGFLLSTAGSKPTHANPGEKTQAVFIEKVRQGIRRLGVGEAARVEVTLRDKTKIKGYISEANEDSFRVMNPASGTATTVSYPQVRQVKGNNLSTGAVIAIVGGAVFLVALLANIFGG